MAESSATRSFISTLDARDLESPISAPQPTISKEADLLRTHNFCVALPEYCLNVSRKYLFGESETVRLDDLKPRIEAIGPDRDIVLVTHDGHNDLMFMRSWC
jgi:hypothetical protein